MRAVLLEIPLSPANTPPWAVTVGDISDHMAYVNNYMIKRYALAWNEDLLSDTIMRCLSRFHQFRGNSLASLRCWMTSIARNMLFDSLRIAKSKRAGYATVSMTDLGKGWREPSYTINPVKLLDLRRALMRLEVERPLYHEVLVKRWLDTPTSRGGSAERTRVFRAVAYLREYVGTTKRTIP